MVTLCIETSTNVCSAALTVGGVVVASRMDCEGANHARVLPVFVSQLLDEARQRQLTLEAVALSDGPGSYTGLRIGASTAKGLCYGLNIPLYPIRTTRVLCAAFAAQSDHNSIFNIQYSIFGLCPMLDARRMEVYTALYDLNLQPLTDIEARVIDADSFAEQLAEQHIIFFGNGADKCQTVITHPHAHFVTGILPDAQYMGVLAEQMTADEAVTGTQLAYYEPFYLKEFQAAPSHVKGLK